MDCQFVPPDKIPHSVTPLPIAEQTVHYYYKDTKLCKNDRLEINSMNYDILTSLGAGSYGEVRLGWNPQNKEYVGIKVLKKRKNVTLRAIREMDILEKIKCANGARFHLLAFHFSFIWKGRFCFMLEALHETVLQFMERRKNLPLRINEIRPILKQTFIALNKLQEMQIIHTDLKPDNIMFVDSVRTPYLIKIIDFGNAITLKEANKYRKLQVLYYRSPEVILGAPYGNAIDIWSVGCIAAKLYLGSSLYRGSTEYDQIRLICETQGRPSTNMLNKGIHTNRYFTSYGPLFWLLKSPEEYEMQSGIKSKDYCRYKFKSLNELVKFDTYKFENPCTAVNKDKEDFVDLLKHLLSVDDSSRISAKAALQHPFITMANLVKHSHVCNYARDGVELMQKLQL